MVLKIVHYRIWLGIAYLMTLEQLSKFCNVLDTLERLSILGWWILLRQARRSVTKSITNKPHHPFLETERTFT